MTCTCIPSSVSSGESSDGNDGGDAGSTRPAKDLVFGLTARLETRDERARYACVLPSPGGAEGHAG